MLSDWMFVGAVVAVTSGCANVTVSVDEGDVQEAISELLARPENRLPTYRPRVSTGTGSTRRHVPLVVVSGAGTSESELSELPRAELTQWLTERHDVDADGRLDGHEEGRARSSFSILRGGGAAAPFFVELPEYVYGVVSGEPDDGSPFFYGRSMDVRREEWRIRHRPLEPPVWRAGGDGRLEMNVPLAGGFVQHLLVSPGDGVFVLWCGITNASSEPLTDVVAQICVQPESAGFADASPGAFRVSMDGDLIDGVAEPIRGATESANRESPLRFIVSLDQVPPEAVGNVVSVGNLDISAIALADPVFPDRYLVLYSPSARSVFFNTGPPCVHANPCLGRIEPGETRWGATFCMVFQGDLAWFFEQLKAIDARYRGSAISPQERRKDDGVTSDVAG